MPELVLTGVRWSGLVSSQCARRVWFEHHGQAQDEPDEKTRNLWRRGHRFEALVVEEILDELAEKGITGERQALLAWPDAERPIGETHLDLLANVADSIRVVEVKSNAGATLQESAALQVAGQAMLAHDQLAHVDRGDAPPLVLDVDAFVEAVDTHTGERRSHVVRWESYAVEVEELWALARGAVDATEIPDRVVDHPGASNCMFCPFKGACFADWEPTPIDQVIGLDAVGGALLEVDAELKLRKEQVKGLTERQDELRDQLRPHLPVGELVGVGTARVKLTVYDATTFSLKEARTAGLELPDEFAPYVSTSPRERWTTK